MEAKLGDTRPMIDRDHLPAEKELVWHPVSKRLPEYNIEVLLTVVDKQKHKKVILGQRYRTDFNGEHWANDRLNDISQYPEKNRVLAWMPKLEHYRGT